MNPTNSLIQQAQQQAEQGFQNQFNPGGNPAGITPSSGSTSDQAMQALSPTQNAAPSAPASPHASLLERLLPTIGGIGGGLLAGGLDLATGGLAIPFDAALAGGGAALGKAGENALTHQSLGSGVLGAAAGGAIGQGAGEGAGMLLGKAGGALGSFGAKNAQAASDAASQATTDQAAQDAIKSRAMALKDIPVKRQAQLNATDSLNHVDNMGFDSTNPSDVSTVANNSNDILNEHLNNALAGSGTFDLSHYPQIVKDALANQSDVLDSYAPVGLAKGRMGVPSTPAGKLLTAMENLGMGKATTSSDPEVIRTLTTKLGNMAQKYKGSDLPESKAAGDAINEVRNNVKTALYDRPEVNDALNAATGNITTGDAGTQQLADHINGVINNAGANASTPAQGILNEISRNINTSDLGKDMSNVKQIATSTGAQARAAADAGVTPAPAAAGKGNLLSADNIVNGGSLYEGLVGGHPLALAAPMALKAAESPAAQMAAGKGLSALGGSPLPGILGATIGTAPADASGPADQSTAVQNPQGSNDMSPLQAAILSGLYNPNSAIAGQEGSLVGSQQKVNAATAAEQNLAQIFNQAGGAQGPLGGILSRLGGALTGNEAGQYGGQAQADAQAIAAATGAPVQEIQKSLPSLGVNQSAAQASLGRINSLIQSLTGLQAQPSNGLISSVY